MRYRNKFFLLGIIISTVFFGTFYQTFAQEEGEIIIPPEEHKKAVKALKTLGPERGALKLSFKVLTIEGIIREVSSNSQKIQAALKQLGAKETESGYLIELPSDILFDFDKWSIRPDAEESLAKVADIIKAYKSPKIIIAGHTDSKGSDSYNLELSQKRAAAVKNWLSEKGGVDETIMETKGYGESKPAAPNTNPDGTDNPEGRQKNRRVEIVIKKQNSLTSS